MRRFSILLSLPKERVEAVVWVHGDVEVWSECARGARYLVRPWGGLYWCTIASDTTECANGIRSARTEGGQHDGTATVGSCFSLYSDGHSVTALRWVEPSASTSYHQSCHGPWDYKIKCNTEIQ